MLLLGIEPNVRWRTFTTLVAEPATDLGVELVVTLGSLLADVPHTRPSPVTGSASDPELVDASGCRRRATRDRPGSSVSCTTRASRRHPVGEPLAAVPHYVSLAPSPRAALALAQAARLAEIDTTELEEASEAYAQQVSEAVASDPETAAYVEELEQRTEEIEEEEENRPSGDAIAAELTRYLRERERENGGPEGPAGG